MKFECRPHPHRHPHCVCEHYRKCFMSLLHGFDCRCTSMQYNICNTTNQHATFSKLYLYRFSAYFHRTRKTFTEVVLEQTCFEFDKFRTLFFWQRKVQKVRRLFSTLLYNKVRSSSSVLGGSWVQNVIQVSKNWKFGLAKVWNFGVRSNTIANITSLITYTYFQFQ